MRHWTRAQSIVLLSSAIAPNWHRRSTALSDRYQVTKNDRRRRLAEKAGVDEVVYQQAIERSKRGVAKINRGRQPPGFNFWAVNLHCKGNAIDYPYNGCVELWLKESLTKLVFSVALLKSNFDQPTAAHMAFLPGGTFWP